MKWKTLDLSKFPDSSSNWYVNQCERIGYFRFTSSVVGEEEMMVFNNAQGHRFW